MESAGLEANSMKGLNPCDDQSIWPLKSLGRYLVQKS